MGDKIKIPTEKSGSSKLADKIPSPTSRIIRNNELEMQKLKIEEKKKERGLIGNLWGAMENSSNNIAGIFIIAILLIGSLYTAYMVIKDVYKTHQQVLDFWNLLTPLLTMALGYIFGRKM